MLTDAQIMTALDEGGRDVPYPGEWLEPPFAGDGEAVIAEDAGLSQIRVDRATGRVWAVSMSDAADAGERFPLAPSPAALARIATAYADACRRADGAPDEVKERIAAEFAAVIESVEEALVDGDAFWSLQAEEIESGLTDTDAEAVDEPVVIRGATGPTVLIGRPRLALMAALRAEGLSSMDYRTKLSYSYLDGSLAEALASTAVEGAWRTGPAQVLVLDAESPVDVEAINAFAPLRLVVLHGTERPDGLAERLMIERIDGAAPYTSLAELVERYTGSGAFAAY